MITTAGHRPVAGRYHANQSESGWPECAVPGAAQTLYARQSVDR
ncbi:MAG: hypothetical protein WKF84_09380 [Pyrinomonadaceae bacterium]